jgi:hypothetical protein
MLPPGGRNWQLIFCHSRAAQQAILPIRFFGLLFARSIGSCTEFKAPIVELRSIRGPFRELCLF